MPVTLGLNGFGRIGRYLTRLMIHDPEIDLKVVNARGDNDSLAHLFRYDSVHGTFKGEVGTYDDGLLIDGRKLQVTRHPLNEWKWKDLGVDIVVESTGKVKNREGLQKHIDAGAKKSIISAPAADSDLTVVMGVNHDKYDPKNHHVISNASCTTNCLAPVVKVLHEQFGIERGLMTTIHSYTMSQRLLDGTHKDQRRGRAAAVNMVPTTTGAARAISLIMPELKGKLDGMAVRVPTPNVSLVDFTCTVQKDVSRESVNAALKEAAETYLKGNLGYTEEQLVSCDFLGSTFGGVVDSECTAVQDKRLVKVIIWYDNEAGFSNQLARLIHMVARNL